MKPCSSNGAEVGAAGRVPYFCLVRCGCFTVHPSPELTGCRRGLPPPSPWRRGIEGLRCPPPPPPRLPAIQGCILFILLVFVLINLLVDVLYAYIDPRIDYG